MARKQTGPRERLRKELVSLLEQVDDEGLVFLIRQAQTIIHNLQIDRINTEITELNKAKAQKGRRPAGKTRPAVEASPVTIEEGAGRTSFVIAAGNARKVFSVDEMRALARVAHAAANDADGARRLHAWLSRNRTDVLVDLGAQSAAHPALIEIHRAIRSAYKPRDSGR